MAFGLSIPQVYDQTRAGATSRNLYLARTGAGAWQWRYMSYYGESLQENGKPFGCYYSFDIA